MDNDAGKHGFISQVDAMRKFITKKFPFRNLNDIKVSEYFLERCNLHLLSSAQTCCISAKANYERAKWGDYKLTAEGYKKLEYAAKNADNQLPSDTLPHLPCNDDLRLSFKP